MTSFFLSLSLSLSLTSRAHSIFLFLFSLTHASLDVSCDHFSLSLSLSLSFSLSHTYIHTHTHHTHTYIQTNIHIHTYPNICELSIIRLWRWRLDSVILPKPLKWGEVQLWIFFHNYRLTLSLTRPRTLLLICVNTLIFLPPTRPSILSSTLLSSQGQPWHSGSAPDCRSAGCAIDPAPMKGMIHNKFKSLVQAKYSLTVENT